MALCRFLLISLTEVEIKAEPGIESQKKEREVKIECHYSWQKLLRDYRQAHYVLDLQKGLCKDYDKNRNLKSYQKVNELWKRN